MNFDEIIDRRGTHCVKWDMMEPFYGVSPDTGLAMWVADMDFRPPQVVRDSVAKMVDHGVFGYFGDDSAYFAAIQWWMKTRHGWEVAKDHIMSTHGLVNGTGLCVDAFTKEGDGVVLFTPVYHAFARVIAAAGREVISCPLVQKNGRYEMDLEAYSATLPAHAKMVILCSPHNPGGRVWSQEELEAVAAFAKRHDLILVSDEIHHDLTMPGQTHIPMAKIAGIADRLVMMTSASKTFNIAACHTGQVIIADPALRARFAARLAGLGISANAFGMHMTTAAYSPEGAAWVDALRAYLDGNRALFDAGINAIPGLKSMALESTYLAWVDFAGTGMDNAEITRRIAQDAGIAVNQGDSFGQGGESFMRFNLAMPRAQISDAVARMQKAFGDLQ